LQARRLKEQEGRRRHSNAYSPMITSPSTPATPTPTSLAVAAVAAAAAATVVAEAVASATPAAPAVATPPAEAEAKAAPESEARRYSRGHYLQSYVTCSSHNSMENIEAETGGEAETKAGAEAKAMEEGEARADEGAGAVRRYAEAVRDRDRDMPATVLRLPSDRALRLAYTRMWELLHCFMQLFPDSQHSLGALYTHHGDKKKDKDEEKEEYEKWKQFKDKAKEDRGRGGVGGEEERRSWKRKVGVRR
jgi:hypothetical protein